MSPDFGGTAGFGERPAVLVVDLNLGFTDPSSPLACDLDDVVASTRELLDAARENGVPVLFTTVSYDAVAEAAAAVFLRKVPALRILEPGSRWIELDEDVLAFEITAESFLRHMVRTLVGTMLENRDIQPLLDGLPRREAGATAPPHGLYLTGVRYK